MGPGRRKQPGPHLGALRALRRVSTEPFHRSGRGPCPSRSRASHHRPDRDARRRARLQLHPPGPRVRLRQHAFVLLGSKVQTGRGGRAMSAAMHEVRVYLASHPVVFGFAEATRKMGDIVDVPGVARIVNRPELAREILLDGEHFSKSGPGSFGVLITQVMGESALLNMDSDAHHRLRSRLQDLFAPAYLETIA